MGYLYHGATPDYRRFRAHVWNCPTCKPITWGQNQEWCDVGYLLQVIATDRARWPTSPGYHAYIFQGQRCEYAYP